MTFSYITISISLKPDVTVLISPVPNLNVDENKEQIKKIVIYMNNEVQIKERDNCRINYQQSPLNKATFYHLEICISGTLQRFYYYRLPWEIYLV